MNELKPSQKGPLFCMQTEEFGGEGALVHDLVIL